LYVAVDIKLPVALLSFPLAEVFYMKIYFKYKKYTRIVFQLQNTNYFVKLTKYKIGPTLNVF